jgi:hypothetical protein
MNDSIRRIVMLCTILTVGLIVIFFDMTLVQLFFIMVVVVIVLPFLLGIATVAEVRTTLRNMNRTGIPKRLNEMKFFEKSSSPREQKSQTRPDKAQQKTGTSKAPKTADTSGGLGTHLKSMVSSFSSIGTIFRERSRREKKVEDINRMLDKTVSEKVTRTPAPAAAKGGGGETIPLPAPGGAGFNDNTDPFLSLSGDEFDAGLLDGLDESPAQPVPSAVPEPGGEPRILEDLLEPELSMPSLESMGESPGAPADPASGLDAFSGLGGGDSMDADFGDLDNLGLDDVELDEANETAAPAAPASKTPVAVAPAPPEVPQPGSSAIKTAWIPSDAPTGADQPEDQLGVQSDMASFAGGAAGTDEDLLSSIASDVRTVKKEKDVSLLRELRDFKAPASEIEQELQNTYQKIGAAPKTKDKNPSPAGGIK